ncbi:MAG: DUF1902 domain-containing protein [Oscillospiraceae bacterium]|nr:DUF1902 domain-containing protein [Oscillospiraceae bacterium]
MEDIIKEYIININWDCHRALWRAVCDKIPVTLESESFDAILDTLKDTVPDILKSKGASSACVLHFVAERRDDVGVVND